jgi:uncharacterized protein (DUF1778 family)
MIEESKKNEIIKLLEQKETYDYIAENAHCSKKTVSDVKKEWLASKESNGKPKTPIEVIDIKMNEIIEEKEPSFITMKDEDIKEFLDSLDYNTIGDICDRVIKQLRGKIPENSENSKTANIVVKAYFLKKKLIRLGLIQEITDEIIKEIREVD